MRILIADADQNFVESFQSYMWECGHDAEFATTGIECSAILYRFTPDVLIIERGLLWGGCDGILAKMQDQPDLAQIPVIILIATSPAVNEHWDYPNIVAWMQKPFQLRDTLEQILSTVEPSHAIGVARAGQRMRSLSQ
jgi:DNA-binding response OmpR family regulator